MKDRQIKIVALAMGLATALFTMNSYANTDAECQKLWNDRNLIYAANGFCFKNEQAKEKFGNEDCYTSKPKFSKAEQARLDSIESKAKELSCKLD